MQARKWFTLAAIGFSFSSLGTLVLTLIDYLTADGKVDSSRITSLVAFTMLAGFFWSFRGRLKQA
jgi:hypothetical protein